MLHWPSQKIRLRFLLGRAPQIKSEAAYVSHCTVVVVVVVVIVTERPAPPPTKIFLSLDGRALCSCQ